MQGAGRKGHLKLTATSNYGENRIEKETDIMGNWENWDQGSGT